VSDFQTLVQGETMTYFFTDKVCTISKTGVVLLPQRNPQAATRDGSGVAGILAAIAALGSRLAARRKTPPTYDAGQAPRTLAEINAAAAELWPRRKPLPSLPAEKTSGGKK
jgi:hypothetical protein